MTRTSRDSLPEMLEDEHDPGPITVVEHDRGLRVGFIDGIWDVSFPPGARRLDGDEDDLWCWGADEAAFRIRLRRHPRVQLEVDVTNPGADVATIVPPAVALSPGGPQVPWFAGSAGEVLHALPEQTVLWRQQRGSCVAKPEGFGLFPEPLLLRPGQTASAAWRRHILPPATLAPEPAWVPRERYLRRNDTLEVEHSDAALVGEGLQIQTTTQGSDVDGDPGLHQLSFLDARGTALVEVGWFSDLAELASSASVLGDPDPNLVAWMLAGGVTATCNLDVLDVVLADAMEQPSVWGVLAGMRAATLTDLPVAAEVREAALRVWRSEEDPHLRRLLLTHGVLAGWEPELVGQWLRSPRLPGDVDSGFGPQEMLGSIGFGRITSSPAVHGGRDVAVAGMWLGTRAESVVGAEWERAVDVARKRLLCALSERPEALDIAWLIAESLIS